MYHPVVTRVPKNNTIYISLPYGRSEMFYFHQDKEITQHDQHTATLRHPCGKNKNSTSCSTHAVIPNEACAACVMRDLGYSYCTHQDSNTYVFSAPLRPCEKKKNSTSCSTRAVIPNEACAACIMRDLGCLIAHTRISRHQYSSTYIFSLRCAPARKIKIAHPAAHALSSRLKLAQHA